MCTDAAYQELLDITQTQLFSLNNETVAPTIHLANKCDEFILDRIPSREYYFAGATKPILYHHPHDILEYVTKRGLFDAHWVERANNDVKHPSGYKGFKKYDKEFATDLDTGLYKLMLFNLWVDGFDAIQKQNFCSMYISFANVGLEVSAQVTEILKLTLF